VVTMGIKVFESSQKKYLIRETIPYFKLLI